MQTKTKTVRLRPSRGATLFIPAFALGTSLFDLFLELQNQHHPAELKLFALVWVPIILLGGFTTTWFGVNLTSDELVVHNLRRKNVPWSKVQAITTESAGSGWRAVVWTEDGTRIPLRAPSAPFRRRSARFERQFAQLGDWWLDHRGPDWQPHYAMPANDSA
jgi:hypothetical protein